MPFAYSKAGRHPFLISLFTDARIALKNNSTIVYAYCIAMYAIFYRIFIMKYL